MAISEDVLRAVGVVTGGIIATITPIVVAWFRKRYTKDQEATTFIHNTEYRVLINEVLVEIRTLTGANRVAILEYHNGNVAINGLPFNYASMTYEKTDITTKEMMMSFQKIPISPFSELLLDVHNCKTGYITVDNTYIHKGVVEFQKYYGLDTVISYRIGDHIKYGTVHLMWINEPAEALSQEIMQEVHYKIMHINELMKKMKKH